MIRQVLVARVEDFPSVPRDRALTEVKRREGEALLLLAVDRRLRELLGDYGGRVVDLPAVHWQVRLPEKFEQPLPPLEWLVIALAFPDQASVNRFRADVERVNGAAREKGKPEPFSGVSADLSLAETEYFCPAGIEQLLFGDRDSARMLTGSGALARQGLTGQNVNVVVIDQGFDASKVRHFGGGMAYDGIEPGTTTRGHGLMLVRNIMDAAPDATFYDVPLIPAHIANDDGFISSALHVFLELKLIIDTLRQAGVAPWTEPCVLVNAWSIFNRATEVPLGDYSQNRDNPLNLLVGEMVDDGIDIVFAAGNCGQFCPDRRCGKLDVGPGSSIWGANSHPQVLTVGAVRTDAIWMGNSSQGPGQPLLSRWKPDLCAPSYFREVDDAFTGNTDEALVARGSPDVANTGTSAACGLTAGIVAAIRSGWDPNTLRPQDLKQALNTNARKISASGWNGRFGHGVIDVPATLKALEESSGE